MAPLFTSNFPLQQMAPPCTVSRDSWTTIHNWRKTPFKKVSLSFSSLSLLIIFLSSYPSLLFLLSSPLPFLSLILHLSPSPWHINCWQKSEVIDKRLRQTRIFLYLSSLIFIFIIQYLHSGILISHCKIIANYHLKYLYKKYNTLRINQIPVLMKNV